MIAAVKGCHAVFSALLFLLPSDARAADDLGGAARELARKALAWSGKSEALTTLWRNLSSLSATEFAQAQNAFEAVMRDAGVRTGDPAAAAELRITLSENPAQYLMVAEARRGDDRQVLMTSWRRSAAAKSMMAGTTLERRLLIEQPDPILDAALTANGLVVLSTSRIALYTRRDSRYEERAAVPIARTWPRDPRARLNVSGTSVRAFLPGALCTGVIEPALTFECQAAESPWTLDAGGQAVLLANYMAARNQFDGRIVNQSGARKTVAPFFTAAPAQDGGRTYWLFAMVDDRVQILDTNFDPAGAIAGWGSDLAATSARCGGGSQILASRPGEGKDADAVRVYALANRTPVALSAPVDFPGPVTALWSAGGPSAVAVVHDAETGTYAAYLLTVVCGEQGQ